MAMLNRINLKVMILDTDFYALRALNSYLAWDRRTRVIALPESEAQALEFIRSVSLAEQPDVLLLEPDSYPNAVALGQAITRFRALVEDLIVLCLPHRAAPDYVEAAQRAGARGYLLRNEVRLRLVGAILHAQEHPFVITEGVPTVPRAELLPPQREYPEMTERIRQALWLCVIEGMPAQLAADEMGISPHTIRSYIKEGYRILEAYDDADYPDDMGPLERAFVRFTALEKPDQPERKNDQPE